MKFRIEVICMNEEGTEERCEIMQFERNQLVMETLDLTLAESKAILEDIQGIVVNQQVTEDLNRRRICPVCSHRFTSKGQGTIALRTVFGVVEVPNPRWNRCLCQEVPKSFRPVSRWLQGLTTPELLHLETKWGSLIPFAKVSDLLKDVLPVVETTNKEIIRRHLHRVAERMEEELGEERPHIFASDPENGQPAAIPDGPITIGIDGGYVRAAHKHGCFEVIAGKSEVSFRRDSKRTSPKEMFRICTNL